MGRNPAEGKIEVNPGDMQQRKSLQQTRGGSELRIDFWLTSTYHRLQKL